MSTDTRPASLPPVSAGEIFGLAFLFDRFLPAGLSTEGPLVCSLTGSLLAGSSSLVSADTLPSLKPLSSWQDS